MKEQLSLHLSEDVGSLNLTGLFYLLRRERQTPTSSPTSSPNPFCSWEEKQGETKAALQFMKRLQPEPKALCDRAEPGPPLWVLPVRAEVLLQPEMFSIRSKQDKSPKAAEPFRELLSIRTNKTEKSFGWFNPRFSRSSAAVCPAGPGP